VGSIVGVCLAIALARRLVRRYDRFLAHAAAFAHLKVVISFLTVVATLDSQYGVVWPASFARALDAMMVISFDVGAIMGAFCFVDISFYHTLLSSTLVPLCLVVAIIIVYRATGRSAQQSLVIGVYLLLFAYPVVSVRVVETFACHDIEGTRYLRADYSIRCDSAQWAAIAVYAGVWVALYVFAFPVAILVKLWSYQDSPSKVKARSQQSLTNSKRELVNLRFLLIDYKEVAPVLLWEGIEMLRKLLLSVVGAFWSTKSTMSIATAMVISAFFLVIHTTYQPFKSRALNRLQALALTVLTLLYTLGVLLRSETVEAGDQEHLGVLMVLLLVSVFVAVLVAVGLELYMAKKWITKVSHAFKIMYKGKIHDAKGIYCIASFPGKYEGRWNQITELGSNEIAKRSIACVFLPQHTPRFGTHDVDDERPDGQCFCHSIYGEEKAWGCGWWVEWKKNVMEAHFRGQVFQVFYFAGQVGQGEIKWKECAKQSLLRDRVMEKQPKDEAGWPKTMSPEEEANFLETLSEEERHCMVGLGGSQKAEVAWMEANGIEFERHDVEKFFADMSDSEEKRAAFWGKHDKQKAPKEKTQLKKVLRETKKMLEQRVAKGACIAVTSFRKGGVNKEHGFLHQVQSCLSLHPPIPERPQVGYVHFQSGFENSLFGWRSGSDACEYGMQRYFDLNMEQCWYIEWLEIVNQCVAHGGYLIVFDLSGEAAMNSSINCAMELTILYRLYHEQGSIAGLVLVVLNDDDVVFNDEAKLAVLLQTKSQDQATQKVLFEKAYEKCYAFFQSYTAITTGLGHVGVDWMDDFKTAGGGRRALRRFSTALLCSTHFDKQRSSSEGQGIKRQAYNGTAHLEGEHQNPLFDIGASTNISEAPSCAAPLSREESSRVFGEELAEEGVLA
jgi:hypothetical protein